VSSSTLPPYRSLTRKLGSRWRGSVTDPPSLVQAMRRRLRRCPSSPAGDRCHDIEAVWAAVVARRQVTTDPLPRRMIRTSGWLSPSSISRTRSRSVTGPVSVISTGGESPQRGANLTCYGTGQE
jgi:hypothetical protein